VIPGIGHPFEGKNKFWSPPHDMGYAGCAIVIDLNTEAAKLMTPEKWARCWEYVPAHMQIDPHSLGREWWDDTMVEGMQLCNEHRAKQFIAYRGVRLGGRSPRKEGVKAVRFGRERGQKVISCNE